jgi:two-component system chemotaxis response regulator CheB
MRSMRVSIPWGRMPSRHRNVVVIGTSAGGLRALTSLISQLPGGLPAAVFVVQHMSPDNTGEALLSRLGRYGTFRCKLGEDGERFGAGGLYLAPSDHHMLIKARTLTVIRGARENRYRPAIDPTMRSAAVSHGSRAVGVVLTGMLDDGTAGLQAIKQCGGVTVVQDPDDAEYPDMPRSALRNMKVDHCLPVAEMGPLLEALTHGASGKKRAIPRQVRIEAEIAERALSEPAEVDSLGTRAPYSCPACGGVLWDMPCHGPERFRCHTGHSFTAAALLAAQSDKLDETLWVTLRMLEERRNLMERLARREPNRRSKRYYTDEAKRDDAHVKRIREMLLAPQESGATQAAGGRE